MGKNTSEFHAGRWSWLPGQGCGLQSWYSIADPTQGKPPFLGSGFVHVLFLILKPNSQSLEQEDQAPQKDQPPLIIRAEVLPVLRRSSTRASRKTNKTPHNHKLISCWDFKKGFSSWIKSGFICLGKSVCWKPLARVLFHRVTAKLDTKWNLYTHKLSLLITLKNDLSGQQIVAVEAVPSGHCLVSQQ